MDDHKAFCLQDHLEGIRAFGGQVAEFESIQGQGYVGPGLPLALDRLDQLGQAPPLAVDSLMESMAFLGLDLRVQKAELAAHTDCPEGCTPWGRLLQ